MENLRETLFFGFDAVIYANGRIFQNRHWPSKGVFKSTEYFTEKIAFIASQLFFV